MNTQAKLVRLGRQTDGGLMKIYIAFRSVLHSGTSCGQDKLGLAAKPHKNRCPSSRNETRNWFCSEIPTLLLGMRPGTGSVLKYPVFELFHPTLYVIV